MANHHLNHLAFYGIAISSVLVLFKVVSAYGETELKAPVNINGVYELRGHNLPNCLASKSLELDLEQSGIYLFGNLAIQGEKIPLSGDLEDKKVVMTGNLRDVCPDLKEQLVTLEGQVKDQKIVGDLRGEDRNVLVGFEGIKKVSPNQEKGGH